MNPEEWKDIPDYSRYAISSYGRIYNKIHEMYMRPTTHSKTGHLQISLINDDEVRRSLSVPLLVAQAFVEPPNDKSRDVIQLDGDLSNLAASNLAWRTHRQAYLYARQHRTDLINRPTYNNLQVRNMETGVVYRNIIQCGIVEGLLFTEIMASCLDQAGTHPDERRVYPHGCRYEFVHKIRS